MYGIIIEICHEGIKMKILKYASAIILYCSVLLLFTGCARTVTPPRVVWRDIASEPRAAKGVTKDISPHAQLFIPAECEIVDTGEVRLTIHFHDAPWFMIEEHIRRGAANPLLIYSGYDSSNAYRIDFEDGVLFPRLLRDTEQELKKHFGIQLAKITAVEISSFSAGYGAVREILRYPTYIKLVDTILLADSMYAAFANPGTDDRSPLPEHIAPFIGFAEGARKGEKIFVITFSSIQPDSFASTYDCARALVDSVGGSLETISETHRSDESKPLHYPPIYKYDEQGLHVWGYPGTDVRAHMAQARNLSEFWKVIDRFSR